MHPFNTIEPLFQPSAHLNRASYANHRQALIRCVIEEKSQADSIEANSIVKLICLSNSTKDLNLLQQTFG